MHWVSELEILRAVGSPGAGGNSKYQKQGLLVMEVNLSSESHFSSYYDDLKDIHVSNLF